MASADISKSIYGRYLMSGVHKQEGLVTLKDAGLVALKVTFNFGLHSQLR